MVPSGLFSQGTGIGASGRSGAPVISVAECEKGIFNWEIPANAQWFPTKDPVSGVANPAFDDPQQGPLPDCHFLAVLGSLALKGRGIPSDTGYITFYQTAIGVSRSFGFRATATFKKAVPLNYSQITRVLPLRRDGVPAGARSKDTNVLWVPVFEKAYACHLEATAAGAFVSDKPKICTIPEGDAVFAFQLLTGNKANDHRNQTIGAGLTTAEATVLAKLQQLCPKISAGATTVAGVPIVAYTYCMGDPKLLNIENPPLDAAPKGSNVIYDPKDQLMVPKHSYSLIGIHTVACAGGGQATYVILRNPYGLDIDPATIPGTYNLLKFSAFTFDTFQYPPKPADGSALPTVVVHNGVFAIHLSDFTRWFMGFCWIP